MSFKSSSTKERQALMLGHIPLGPQKYIGTVILIFFVFLILIFFCIYSRKTMKPTKMNETF